MQASGMSEPQELETVPGKPRLPRWIALPAATLAAPAAAGPAALSMIALLDGAPGQALLMLVLAPFMLIMLPGIYAYIFAFLPTAAFGFVLTLAGDRYPAVRDTRLWLATGAVGALPIAATSMPGPSLFLAASAAGAASALVYRLIVGLSWRSLPPAAG
jgi:hypothetical protein